MPRIPQGNFDTAPSMNVSTAKVEPIKSVGTQILRGAGKQAIQLADAWNNVKAKADALDGVSSAEDEVNAVGEELKQFAMKSQNGKYEGKDISEIAKEKAEAIRSRHLAGMKDNPEQVQLYNQIISPKLDNLVNSAFKQQNEQIRTGTLDNIQNDAYTLQMKMRNGSLMEEDMANYTAKLNASEGILSREEIAKAMATTRKTLAINASSMMGNGWSPEVEAKAKQWVDKLGGSLNEGEKIAAQMNFDRYKEEGMAVANRKLKVETKQIIDASDTRQGYLKVQGKTTEAYKMGVALGPQPFETQEEYQSRQDELGATIIANEVAIANGNVFSDPEKLAKDVSVMKARLLGERAPSSSAMDDLVQRKLTAMQNKIHSKGGAMAAYMDVNPNFMLDMQDPSKIEANMAKVNDFYNANKVDSQNRTVMSVAEAQEYGKVFKKVNSGDSDPTGEHMTKLTRDLQNKFGKYAGQALSDIIQLGGGTASGNTNAPASLAVGNYIQDDNELARIYSAVNRMDENKKAIDSKEYGKIDDAIRNNTILPSIRSGVLSDNDNFANGYMNSVKGLAMTFMANDKMKADNAVEEAEKIMQRSISTSFQDRASVVIPRSALNSKNYTDKDLQETLSEMTNFESLSEMKGNIDWKAMAPINPSSMVGKQMRNIADATDPKEQAKLAQKYFGDSIHVVNDGTNPNNVSMYIRTATDMIPLFMTTPSGKTSRFNVDMLDMINNNKARTPVDVDMREFDTKLYGEN